MHEYLYPYWMLPVAILVLRKNKVNFDLEFLFLLHANDGDCCGSFGNTAIEKLS